MHLAIRKWYCPSWIVFAPWVIRATAQTQACLTLPALCFIIIRYSVWRHTYVLWSIPVSASSDVGLRSLACWNCGFESRGRHGGRSLVIFVYYQVEVSSSIWSIVQRRPTACGVSVCDRMKSRSWGSPGPIGAVAPWGWGEYIYKYVCVCVCVCVFCSGVT